MGNTHTGNEDEITLLTQQLNDSEAKYAKLRNSPCDGATVLTTTTIQPYLETISSQFDKLISDTTALTSVQTHLNNMKSQYELLLMDSSTKALTIQTLQEQISTTWQNATGVYTYQGSHGLHILRIRMYVDSTNIHYLTCMYGGKVDLFTFKMDASNPTFNLCLKGIMNPLKEDRKMNWTNIVLTRHVSQPYGYTFVFSLQDTNNALFTCHLSESSLVDRTDFFLVPPITAQQYSVVSDDTTDVQAVPIVVTPVLSDYEQLIEYKRTVKSLQDDALTVKARHDSKVDELNRQLLETKRTTWQNATGVYTYKGYTHKSTQDSTVIIRLYVDTEDRHYLSLIASAGGYLAYTFKMDTSNPTFNLCLNSVMDPAMDSASVQVLKNAVLTRQIANEQYAYTFVFSLNATDDDQVEYTCNLTNPTNIVDRTDFIYNSTTVDQKSVKVVVAPSNAFVTVSHLYRR